MHTVTAPKSDDRSFTIVIPPVKRDNMLPISLQISLKAQSKRHDKRNSRAKSKRQWRKEV